MFPKHIYILILPYYYCYEMDELWKVMSRRNVFHLVLQLLYRYSDIVSRSPDASVSQATHCCPSLVLVLTIWPLPKPFPQTGLVERLVWSPGPDFFFPPLALTQSLHQYVEQHCTETHYPCSGLTGEKKKKKKDKSRNNLLNHHLNTRTRKVKLRGF